MQLRLKTTESELLRRLGGITKIESKEGQSHLVKQTMTITKEGRGKGKGRESGRTSYEYKVVVFVHDYTNIQKSTRVHTQNCNHGSQKKKYNTN